MKWGVRGFIGNALSNGPKRIRVILTFCTLFSASSQRPSKEVQRPFFALVSVLKAKLNRRFAAFGNIPSDLFIKLN